MKSKNLRIESWATCYFRINTILKKVNWECSSQTQMFSFVSFHILELKEKRDTNLNRNRNHQKFYSHLKFYFKWNIKNSFTEILPPFSQLSSSITSYKYCLIFLCSILIYSIQNHLWMYCQKHYSVIRKLFLMF